MPWPSQFNVFVSDSLFALLSLLISVFKCPFGWVWYRNPSLVLRINIRLCTEEWIWNDSTFSISFYGVKISECRHRVPFVLDFLGSWERAFIKRRLKWSFWDCWGKRSTPSLEVEEGGKLSRWRSNDLGKTQLDITHTCETGRSIAIGL